MSRRKDFDRFYSQVLKAYKKTNPKMEKLPKVLVRYYYENYYRLKLAQYRKKRFQKYLVKAIKLTLETMTRDEILTALLEVNPKIDVEHVQARETWELAEMLIFNLLATSQPVF